tara:strand:- start:6953 stop:7849 length:897 start_codon:yes stop_codon:yes gene_type:complete
MADLIIKPSPGAGNKLVLQTEDATDVLTTSNSGVAITAPTITDLSNVTGTLPVGVTGGSGLTLLKSPRNEGLVVKYVSATTVDIDADFLTVFDTNNVGIVLSSINLTADITALGVNGIDTGSEADVWYHIWVIYNGVTTSSLLSASATSPTMPSSSYTYKKYVGAVKNNSGDFIEFYQRGNFVTLKSIGQDHRTTVNGTATSHTSQSCSNSVPPNAEVLIGYFRGYSTSTRIIAYVAATATGYGEHELDSTHDNNPVTESMNFEFTIIEAQTYYYYRHSSHGEDVDVYITGYKFSGIV